MAWCSVLKSVMTVMLQMLTSVILAVREILTAGLVPVVIIALQALELRYAMMAIKLYLKNVMMVTLLTVMDVVVAVRWRTIQLDQKSMASE